MPIELITGVPGAGKSLYAVKKIKEAVDAGRKVYANVEGLTLPHEPVPEDWRTCPDGAFIVIDECHHRWKATGKPGRTASEEVEALDMHRHRGFDFLLLTQKPTKVHHQVRENVGFHRHLVRPANVDAVTVYSWQHVVIDPDDRQQKDNADVQMVRYDKSLFQFYKSATIHTVKRQIPTRLKMLVGVVTVLLAFVVWNISTTETFLSSAVLGIESEKAEPTLAATAPAGAAVGQAVPPPPPRTIPQPDGLNDWTLAEEVQPIAGCAWNAKYCKCYATNGKPLDFSESECRIAVSRPLPLSIALTSSSGKSVDKTDAAPLLSQPTITN